MHVRESCEIHPGSRRPRLCGEIKGCVKTVACAPDGHDGGLIVEGSASMNVGDTCLQFAGDGTEDRIACSESHIWKDWLDVYSYCDGSWCELGIEYCERDAGSGHVPRDPCHVRS